MLTLSRRFRGAFTAHHVYAYRTYDCVPASTGPRFSDLDLLVSAGLNARPDVTALAALRSFADRAARHLEAAHALQPDFLQLARTELGDDPPEQSAGWHLREAWRQGMATPWQDVARVYKTLHHKRPRLSTAPSRNRPARPGAEPRWPGPSNGFDDPSTGLLTGERRTSPGMRPRHVLRRPSGHPFTHDCAPPAARLGLREG